ncbi:hypothetical protein [Microvirga mediterraneensis]|uniref:Uncharacterized protein n=1 Tax=Microvirga mediterraneensis TaxID=2754695 RepID=A0A838BHQ7_9HYPH|nr:hypothetical protein [Microvirga mediterraneensis]MBA1154649.1 hypothetical protein [Microvirga mediterraneensis]
MSIVILAAFLVTTLVQIVFWEGLGEAFGYAASICVAGLCASITLILAAYVAAVRSWGTSGVPR